MYKIINVHDTDSLLRQKAEELLKQILWTPLGINVDSREVFFSKADERFYVAVSNTDGKLIACIVIAPVDDTLEIRHIAVKEEFQNKGIGTSLVNQIIQEWPRNTIEVIIRNTSTNFWEVLGFTKFGDWADHPEFLKHGIHFHLYKKVSNLY